MRPTNSMKNPRPVTREQRPVSFGVRVAPLDNILLLSPLEEPDGSKILRWIVATDVEAFFLRREFRLYRQHVETVIEDRGSYDEVKTMWGTAKSTIVKAPKGDPTMLSMLATMFFTAVRLGQGLDPEPTHEKPSTD